MLKKLLIGFVVLVAVLIVVIVMQPGTFHVERTASIAGTPEAIYPHIVDLHAMNEWNPWMKLDPNLKLTYEGPASGVGASYGWDGNANVGAEEVEEHLLLQRAREFVDETLVRAPDGHGLGNCGGRPDRRDEERKAWCLTTATEDAQVQDRQRRRDHERHRDDPPEPGRLRDQRGDRDRPAPRQRRRCEEPRYSPGDDDAPAAFRRRTDRLRNYARNHSPFGRTRNIGGFAMGFGPSAVCDISLNTKLSPEDRARYQDTRVIREKARLRLAFFVARNFGVSVPARASSSVHHAPK